MKDAEEYYPKSAKDWRNWLALNHKNKDSIWLIFHKKNTPSHNLSWSEAVDEALCFGWIDSTKKSIDKERFKQYFCKRKAKSNWSKVNKEKVKNLISADLMQEEGYKSIEIAKENGSWTILDSVEDLVVPNDLKKEFLAHPGSEVYFSSLSNSAKKILLYWIVSAKREETRRKRIIEIAQNAGNNMKPKPFR
jgi:uncharacterized protein YdeI (YjbR/CyaY-like superfamily)